MTMTEVRAPRGILANSTVGLTRDRLREIYSVPTVEELRLLKPKAGDGLGNRWKPVDHADYADALVRACHDHGLEIAKETYHLKGHKLQGVFEFANRQSGDGLDRTTGVMGFVADNAQSVARTIAIGEHVFICTNGMVIAEHVVKKKSTTFLNVDELAHRAVELWCSGYAKSAGTIDRLKNTPLSDEDVTMTLARAVGLTDEKQIMSVGFARRVREEYNAPRYEVFGERNAWSLYNAATEMLKHERNLSNEKSTEIQLGMGRLLIPADLSVN